MKFNFKKYIALALVGLNLLPALAFAEDTGNPASSATQTTGAFCARLSTVEQKLADQIIKAETKQTTNESTRAGKIAQKESDTDAKRAQSRADVDGKRLKNWDKMTSKAKTDVEIQAVAVYQASIKTAVADRRTAIDGAVKAYRDSLAGVISTHNGNIDQAMVTFKASIDAALAKAQADCTAGIASKAVKDTFSKTAGDARKVLQATRKAAQKTTDIAAIKKTRNDTIKLAETNFKTATEKARADLILALK